MPVLSPHRSSSSGSYRSSFGSAIDRPYYTSSYNPRISSYSERISTRSYTDADGRRVFSRSGSITEDGVTTRFREETRENSVRRDSLSRDSGISSIRENSIADYPRRDSSLSRGENSATKLSAVLDSVAELRNKYSPANYVPAVYRKNENIARSKSINDIGLPPIESKPAKKKVNDSLNYNNSVGLNSNHTNNDNMDVEDDNGNRTSVADLRKKFDDKPSKTTKSSSPPIENASQKVSDNIFKRQDKSKLENNKQEKSETRPVKMKTVKNDSRISKNDSDNQIKMDLKKGRETGKSSSNASLNGIDGRNGSKASLNGLEGKTSLKVEGKSISNGFEGKSNSNSPLNSVEAKTTSNVPAEGKPNSNLPLERKSSPSLPSERKNSSTEPTEDKTSSNISRERKSSTVEHKGNSNAPTEVKTSPNAPNDKKASSAESRGSSNEPFEGKSSSNAPKQRKSSPIEFKSSLNALTDGKGSSDARGARETARSSSSPLSDTDRVGVRDTDELSVNGFREETKLDPSEPKRKRSENGTDFRGTVEVETSEDDTLEGEVCARSSRISNYASYYPTRTYNKGDETLTNGRLDDGSDSDELDNCDPRTMYENDIAPKLNRSTISPTNSPLVNSTSSVVGTGGGSASPLNVYLKRSASPDKDRNVFNSKDEDRRIYDHQIIGNSHDRVYDRAAGGRGSISGPSAARTQGLNGLKNIGNTCFMNSVIQCLSNTRQLLEYVKKDAYVKDINTSISSMKGALIRAFAEVIKELWSEDSSDRVVNTVSLKSQIQRFAPRFMGYAQQDAQEFLRYLLEGLHEDVNRVTEKPKPILTEIDEKLSDNEKAKESWSRYLRMDNSHIVDLFVGQLKSTLRCTQCGHASVTFDPFWDLSLPIPQRTGQLRLSQCLESFTREETLDGDEKPTCSKCKERRKCTKSFSIQKFPKILVIHLKRFSPTERFRGKLSVMVDFPLEGLDMSGYSAEGVAAPRYNLYAVSNHSGTTYSGHYTAYCRHPYTLTWHEYNDSRVSPISSKNVVSSEAYVLFYELDGQKSRL